MNEGFDFDSVGAPLPDVDLGVDFDCVGETFAPIIIFVHPVAKEEEMSCPECNNWMYPVGDLLWGCDWCGYLKWPSEPILMPPIEDATLTGEDEMPFGKYKGEKLRDVPSGYLQWLIKQDGFKQRNPDLAAYIHLRI